MRFDIFRKEYSFCFAAEPTHQAELLLNYKNMVTGGIAGDSSGRIPCRKWRARNGHKSSRLLIDEETGNAATGIVQATEVGNINKLSRRCLARSSCRITGRSRSWRVQTYPLTSKNQDRKSKQKQQSKDFHGRSAFPRGWVQP